MTVTTVQMSAKPAAVRSMAVIIALVVALVAVVGVSVFYWNHGHVLPSASTSVSQHASAAVVPPANIGNQGSQFLFMLRARGIAPKGVGTESINDAHTVCARYQQGASQQQIAQSIAAGTPSMPAATANEFAKTAIDVYCPQG